MGLHVMAEIMKIETHSHVLSVIGNPENALYGWRLNNQKGDEVAWDENACYGSLHVALREGLIAADRLEG